MILTRAISAVDFGGLLSQAKSLAEYFSITSVASVGLLSYIIWRLYYALYVSPLRNIPGPFISRFTTLRSGYNAIVGKMASTGIADSQKYGQIYVYGPNAVAISNPVDCRTVFGSHAFRKTDFYKMVDMFGHENIFSTRSPEFNSMRRRQIGPSFTQGYLANMEPTIQQYGISALKTKWDNAFASATEKGDAAIRVNYYTDFMYLTFDIIGKLGFGSDLNALKNNDASMISIAAKSMSYFGMVASFQLANYFPFSLLVRDYKNSFEKFAKFSWDSIVARKRMMSDNKEVPRDILQAYIDAVDPESKNRMNDKQVQTEAIVVMLAGADSSSVTLSWTLFILMLHPEIYERLVNDIRTVFDNDHLITYSEARSKLPYLEAVIYESFRLVGVTQGLLPRRSPAGGITLQNHYIPEGTEIYVNMGGVHLNKTVWEEPLCFNPDRFVFNSEAKRDVVTFGTGVRICPGRNLAWIEIFTVLANILKDYDFELPNDSRYGPNVLDEQGYPKKMDTRHFLVTSPAEPYRDCFINIRKRK